MPGEDKEEGLKDDLKGDDSGDDDDDDDGDLFFGFNRHSAVVCVVESG